MTERQWVHTQQHGDVLVISWHAGTDAAQWHSSLQALAQAVGQVPHQAHVVAAVLLLPKAVSLSACRAAAAQTMAWAAVIEAVEACPQPIVAALQGDVQAQLLELALACDARVALAGSRMGLPQITWGWIPDAGGTQRVPRCVGWSAALELVCAGTPWSAQQALQAQLIDAVVPHHALLEHATACARQLQGRKQRVRDAALQPLSAPQWQALTQPWLRKGRGRPHYRAAIEAVGWCADVPIATALAQERARSAQLRQGRDAQALCYQQWAEQQAMQLPTDLQVPARPCAQLAVIGAGTMGTGIAISALDAGLQVLLLEQDAPALQRGVQRVHDFYAQRVAGGKLTAAQAQTRLQALTDTLDWHALSRADVVIEAVFEDMAVKQAVFARIDRHARAGAVLATNTSYLDVDAVAAATSRAADVIGLHFFTPAHVMQLLEVVRGARSAADALATGMALGQRLGKLPVLCGNAFGFIGNRIYNAYRIQAEYMLEDGALPEQVDAALQQFGMAMGPFAVADLSGLDIAWRMRQAQAAARDPQVRYVAILDRLCERGRLGRKSGAGYYRYAQGQAGAAADEEVVALIEQASAQRGLQRRVVPAPEIVRRALMAMCNEAALLLAEGVARQACDIDVVLVQGYGFARWEGGPLFWLSQLDAHTQQQLQQELAHHVGHGFVAGDLSLLRLAPMHA